MSDYEKKVQREMDLAGRKPVRAEYKTHPKCPKCGDDLQLESVKSHWFPYIHVDMSMYCLSCGEVYVFGIPFSRDSGLAMHIWDTNPAGVMEQFGKLDDPDCMWKPHGKMMKTKIFGNWFFEAKDSGRIRFQWKCPRCFLVRQEWHKREADVEGDNPFTDDEMRSLEEKLRGMGYFG